MILRVIVALCLTSLLSCSDSTATDTNKKKKKSDSTDYHFVDVFAYGKDTGFTDLTKMGEAKLLTLICQNWTLSKMEGVEEADQVIDNNNKRIFPELIFFPDSQVVENPRSGLRIGKWSAVSGSEGIELLLSFSPNSKRKLVVQSISSKILNTRELISPKKQVKFILESSGMVPTNLRDQPFHPDNIRWMIRPLKKETDAALFARVREMVRFYGVYYRYHILTGAEEISFIGLPEVFQWYNKGIGLPEKKLVEDSFVKCFYNKEQAYKAYDFLKKIIVDYEYKWPKHTPTWLYATHDVLGQMVHKIDSLQRF